MNRRDLLGSGLLSAAVGARAQAPPAALPGARPVPRMQAVPLPHHEVSFQRDGVELARYHFGPGLRRPFVYPILGPSGRPLTRMGHPHAPVSHSHHNSVWISHDSVEGDSFWSDQGPGRILHQWIAEFTDADDGASLAAVNHWLGAGDRLRLVERRRLRAVPLPEGEWLLVVDLHLEPPGAPGAARAPVTLGKTPFGLIGVRMAKSLGMADGGGLIRNSEGQVGEQGPNGAFWKRARWVDYSGPVLTGVVEGIALFDHPANPNHPSVYHVRADGWMGASLTWDAPRRIEPDAPLRLRYGLYIHRGLPAPAALHRQWERFAASRPEPIPDARR